MQNVNGHENLQLIFNDKAKKKILCLKACENFSNRRGMRFFIFYFILFLLQLAFASTHIRNQKWLKSFNFRIFRNQTGFYTFFELPRA